MSEPTPEERSLRIWEAMPKPLLVIFVLLALVALSASVYVLVKPPTFGTVLLQDRRPPPRAGFTHDPVRVFPAPTPDVALPFEPPCSTFDDTVPIGGAAFIQRVGQVLEQVCTLTGASVSEDTRRAIQGLSGATIRIAEFERSGVESTLDLGTATIWVNLKLTQRTSGFEELIPVLLHDGYHAADPTEPITAEAELAARGVEFSACQQFVPIADWPRWCEDARDLTTLERDEALALLVSAGFQRQVSS